MGWSVCQHTMQQEGEKRTSRRGRRGTAGGGEGEQQEGAKGNSRRGGRGTVERPPACWHTYVALLVLVEGACSCADICVLLGVVPDRQVQDEFAAASHRKAAAAQAAGKFAAEIVPVRTKVKDPKTGAEQQVRRGCFCSRCCAAAVGLEPCLGLVCLQLWIHSVCRCRLTTHAVVIFVHIPRLPSQQMTASGPAPQQPVCQG